VLPSDTREIMALLDDFERAFSVKPPRSMDGYVKVVPSSSRPFSGYYDKTSV
jgi:hypothetical protein